MKRTKGKNTGKADAILVSDLHLTDHTPVSRIDDYIEAQKRKLKFLEELSERNDDCPVICSGDVFDYWKASPWLSIFAYTYLPRPLVCIPGQHDLPGHSLEHYSKSALSLLEQTDADYIQVLLWNTDRAYFNRARGLSHIMNGLEIVGVPFGQLSTFDPADPDLELSVNATKILLLHELVWPGKPPGWARGSHTAGEILDKFGDYFDLILVGDNHQNFTVRQENSLLISPGSMMRINADQKDHQPKCYLYYADDNIAEAVNFPIEDNVHDTSHLEKKKEKDNRITAYIEKMADSWETGLSFRRNLEAFFEENQTPKKVREIIWQSLEKIS